MNTQQLARADYLDILFDGRNKTYGAFELRRHYAQRTRRALGVVLGISCLIAAYPLFASTKPEVTKSIHVISCPILPKIPTAVKKVEVHPARPAHTQSVTPPPRIVFTEPKIVRNELVERPPVVIDSLRDKTIASTTGGGQTGNPSIGLQPGDGPVGPPTIDPPKGGGGGGREIVMKVDQQPAFNGDLGSWLSNHLDYPARAQEDGIQGSVMMQFVVNEDGSISDVTTLSGAGHGFDAEAARVIKMMPRWKPAKLNGEPVRTWFKLPVVFALAEN